MNYQSPPRILHMDFKSPVRVAAQRDILWPCNVFDIYVEARSRGDLGVFVETVLRLSALGIDTKEKLRETISIDERLIVFMQHLLFQKGYLDTRKKITESGIGQIKEIDEAKPIQKVAKCYVDLMGGNVIPFVQTASEEESSIHNFARNIPSKSRNPNVVRFAIGQAAGSEKEITAYKLFNKHREHEEVVPSVREISDAILLFNRRRGGGESVSHEGSTHSTLDPYGKVTIPEGQSPELVYLHCQAIIQPGNSDLFVSDGVGAGFYDPFAKAINGIDASWISELKRSGVVIDAAEPKQAGNLPGFNSAIKTYEHLHRALVQASKLIDRLSTRKERSTFESKQNEADKKDSIVHLNSSLEWAFQYLHGENQTDRSSIELLLKSENVSEVQKRLLEYAAELGFVIDESGSSIFRQLKIGAIRSSFDVAEENVISKLPPLLAIAIIGARSQVKHPLKRLVKEDSHSLVFLNRIKNLRNSVLHGNEGNHEFSLTFEELLSCRDKTHKVIRSIFPNLDLSVMKSFAKEGTPDPEQQRMKATWNLEESYGMWVVNQISPNLKEQLIEAELICSDIQSEDFEPINLITKLSNCLEHAFGEATKPDRKKPESASSVKEIAFSKLREVCSLNEIPEAIRTTNEFTAFAACRGAPSSLGANFIALFYVKTIKQLQILYKESPDFVTTVANLIKLRGGGNSYGPLRDENGDFFDQEKLLKFKVEVFDLIKTMVVWVNSYV